jgi:hypothetical protein
MSVSTMTNGRPRERKQLSDQIDRLDSILDGLADALNEAVADAAREGARVAVKEAIFEILTNPELRELIAPGAAGQPQPAATRPSLFSRFKARLARMRERAATVARPVTEAVAERCRPVKPAVTAMTRVLEQAWRFRKALVIGLAVGAATATVSYLVPHAVSATISGVGGLIAAVGVQVGLRVRRMARRFGLM